MLPTTMDPIAAILKTDPTVPVHDRAGILSAIRNHGRKPPSPPAPQQDRLLRRIEVARLMGRSLRSVDLLARQGVLTRITLPGRRRACGFRLRDVELLISGESRSP